jgi:hypothetical protein
MRFEEAYQGWTEGRLSQAEAALLLGQCERTWSKPPVGEASTASNANARPWPECWCTRTPAPITGWLTRYGTWW